jgi:hypothetical protein
LRFANSIFGKEEEVKTSVKKDFRFLREKENKKEEKDKKLLTADTLFIQKK